MDDTTAPFAAFSDVIETEEELRDFIGPAFPPTLNKVIHHIDDICAAYIAEATFVLMASSDGQGQVDISPKGDPAGFVKVLNPHYIAIPDRPGNRRLDTFTNLLKNPQLALLFMVPGMGETLRVYGQARLVRDPELLDTMAVSGRPPKLATVLHVERAMIHCPKCIMRSHLWGEDAKQPDLPNINVVMATHAHLTDPPEQQFENAKEAGMLDMY